MNQSGVYKSLENLSLEDRRFHTVIQSSKYPRLVEFYSLIARRLHFPDYFGKNFDALEECLMDLDWIKEKQVVIEIKDWKELIKKESSKERKTLWDIFKTAATHWKKEDKELIIIKD